MAMKNPPHPGGFIRRNFIEAHNLTVAAAAAILGVARPSLSNLLNEKVDLSPIMALRIEKAFGVSMDMLLRMQLGYDVAQVREHEKDIKVQPFIPVHA
jgi:antitoxin HigA-1